MRKDRERLQDILEAIEQIERYASQGKSEFEQNELIQVWILHHLQIIGEAARATSDDFKAQYPQIPWLDIADLRNLIVHEYFALTIIWDIVINDVPHLKEQVKITLEGNYS